LSGMTTRIPLFRRGTQSIPKRLSVSVSQDG